MTREEAIDLLENLIGMVEDNHDSDYDMALKMGIKALEQEPCEDAVSRKAVNEIIIKYRNEQASLISEVCLERAYGANMVGILLSDLPSVNIQPKTGHWGRKTKVDAYDIAGVKTWGIKCQCDRCGFTTIVVEDFGYYKYCPNCGCRMEGEIE